MEKNIFDSWLVNKLIAHRGLHDSENPENSLGAYKRAIEKNYAIEIDVRMISDGTVIVFHDEDLKRVCGKDKYVSTLTKDELSDCHLEGTEYTITTFEEVLKLVDGKVPLLVEIKAESKIGKLEQATYDLLKNYNGEYAVQSFNPFSLEWFKKNAPDVWRGQLSCYFKKENLAWWKKSLLKKLRLNKVSCPNFISYRIEDLPNRFVKRCKALPLLVWVVKNQQQYIKAVQICDNVIFEDFEPKI